MSISEEARLRLKRAQSHRTSFEETFTALLKDDSYAIRIESQDDGTGIAHAIRTEPICDDLPLIIGEFFYQLRAALDSIAYQAAVFLTGSDPPPHENRLVFPICPNESDFEKAALHNIPLPNELREWIELVQPYNVPKAKDTPYKGINQLLEILHNCARKDRHRRLHVVGALPKEVSGFLRAEPAARVTFTKAIPCNFFQNESAFLHFGIEDGTPKNVTYVHGQFSIDITIDEIPWFRGNQLREVIRSIERAVEAAIQMFEYTLKSA